MAEEKSKVTVKVKRTLRKFDGEYEEGKTPIEVIEDEQEVPLDSLPADMQDAIRHRDGKGDD